MSTLLSAVYADANRVLKQSVAGIFLVMLTLILCAWFGTERLVMRPIRSLLAMSARLRSGDFAARTGMAVTVCHFPPGAHAHKTRQ